MAKQVVNVMSELDAGIVVLVENENDINDGDRNPEILHRNKCKCECHFNGGERCILQFYIRILQLFTLFYYNL